MKPAIAPGAGIGRACTRSGSFPSHKARASVPGVCSRMDRETEETEALASNNSTRSRTGFLIPA